MVLQPTSIVTFLFNPQPKVMPMKIRVLDEFTIGSWIVRILENDVGISVVVYRASRRAPRYYYLPPIVNDTKVPLPQYLVNAVPALKLLFPEVVVVNGKSRIW